MINSKITIKATTVIPRYGAVTSLGALASSSNPAHENKVIGITEGKMEPGYYYDATITGLLFNDTWNWVPGVQLYLNGTVLSQVPPGSGFIQQMGWALTAQSVLINVQSSGTPPPLVIIPPGLIAMWSGLLVNIPSGWALCDGTLGTPDLRDKFVAGASAGADPGTVSGANTHSHTAHSYTPAGSVSQPTFTGSALATHAHELPFALDGGEVPLDIDCMSQSVFGTGTTRSTTFHAPMSANTESQPVALSESVSAGTPAGTVSQPTFSGTPVSLTHSTEPNVPVNYAVAFIMKL